MRVYILRLAGDTESFHKEKEMRFVQFRQSDDDKETIRVGIQRENGNLVDLSHALPNCQHLVHALTKHGIQGVIDAAAESRYFLS